MTNKTPRDTTDKPTEQSDATSIEHNKAVSRRWIEVFNERDDAGEADVRAQDYVAYAPVSLEPAPLDSEAWTRFLAGFVEAFPDLQLTVEDAVAEGDLVAQRIHFEGTHTGEFQGLPPTQRKVSFSGLELNRFVDGRVVEHWFQMDSLTLLQQLGLVVVPGPAVAAASPEPSVEEAAEETLIRDARGWARRARPLEARRLGSMKPCMRITRPSRSSKRTAVSDSTSTPLRRLRPHGRRAAGHGAAGVGVAAHPGGHGAWAADRPSSGPAMTSGCEHQVPAQTPALDAGGRAPMFGHQRAAVGLPPAACAATLARTG